MNRLMAETYNHKRQHQEVVKGVNRIRFLKNKRQNSKHRITQYLQNALSVKKDQFQRQASLDDHQQTNYDSKKNKMSYFEKVIGDQLKPDERKKCKQFLMSNAYSLLNNQSLQSSFYQNCIIKQSQSSQKMRVKGVFKEQLQKSKNMNYQNMKSQRQKIQKNMRLQKIRERQNFVRKKSEIRFELKKNKQRLRHKYFANLNEINQLKKAQRNKKIHKLFKEKREVFEVLQNNERQIDKFQEQLLFEDHLKEIISKAKNNSLQRKEMTHATQKQKISKKQKTQEDQCLILDQI